jgi:hypothetical protein
MRGIVGLKGKAPGLGVMVGGGTSLSPSFTTTIRHETGDLTEYTGTATNTGRLTAAATAGLGNSNFGLNCLIQNTTAMYGAKTVTAKAGRARIRFYIDPNTLTMTTNDEIAVLGLRNSADAACGWVYLNYSSGYRIRVSMIDNATTEQFSASYAITDAPHCVEVYLTQGATGTMSVWIDGVYQGATGGFNNLTKFDKLGIVRFGVLAFKTGTPTGTLLLDELVITDGGLAIGALSTPLITNGVFANTDGWTAIGSTLASIAGGQAGNCLRITNGTGYNSCWFPVFGLSGPHTLTFYHKNGTGQGYCAIGTTAAAVDIYDPGVACDDAAWAQKSYTFSLTGADAYITFWGWGGAGTTTLFDEVVLTKN